jgi:hypothetical protein
VKKLILSLIAITGLSIAANAQQYQTITLQSAVKLNGGATGTYTLPVNVRAADSVGITTKTCLDGAGTEEIIFKFAKSVDGVYFETTPSILVTNTSNGTTQVISFKTVDVTGAHTIRLASVVNGSSGQVVTNYVYVGVKNFLR